MQAGYLILEIYRVSIYFIFRYRLLYRELSRRFHVLLQLLRARSLENFLKFSQKLHKLSLPPAM